MSREFSVKTNCFAVTRLPTKEYYQYEVVFIPEIKIFRKRQEVIHRLQNKVAQQIFHPRALYDSNALLYTSHRLKLPGGGSGSFLVNLSDVDRGPIDETMRGVIKVTITRTAGEKIRPSDIHTLMQTRKITSQSASALNLLQLLIKQATNQNFPHNARAFFSSAGSKSIGGGLELWRGFFQSVRPTVNRILVNIDTSITTMYQSGGVLDVALSFSGLRDIRQLPSSERDRGFKELEHFLKGLLIHVEGYFGKRTKVIKAIIPRGGRFQFDKDGRSTTVADHAHLAHSLTTRFPDAFGVVLSGKNAPRPVIVPAEFCTIQSGQLYKKKLPNHLTSEMVSFATISPRDRLGAITSPGSTRSLASPICGYVHSEYIVESGMQISPTPLEIRGKILDTPKVTMGQGSELRPIDGAWNMKNQRVQTPGAELAFWGVINFMQRSNERETEQHARALFQELHNIGMRAQQPALMKMGNGGDVERSLNGFMDDFVGCTGKTAQIIVVLFPNKGDEIRNQVKRWGDVKHGILTQHMKADKLQRANAQYYANVAIKINARLGGSNHIVKSPTLDKLSSAALMIMGADVSHNSPSSLRPSIWSLVWSHDIHTTQYVAYCGVQHPRTESIAEVIKAKAKAAIDQFAAKHKVPPAAIIFYRDGISEGEFDAVGQSEVAQLQAAIDELWVERNMVGRAAKPKITFLIVGKRHHMVFFGQDDRTMDRTGNLKAGFVTTGGVESALYSDFYLQSHAAIKGTSRSGHYIVLRDDNFGGDQHKIQDLSYTLCHTYAKATRSVSIPTPVYYAHEVCTRGVFHFDDELRYGGDDTSSTTSGRQDFNLHKWEDGWKALHPQLHRSMYFL